MISIVIPLYNKASCIRDTLLSVLAQIYSDFEIIIVDDGSTDESCHVVESIIDSRIRLVHQTNAGVAAARNRGIEEARGDYIAFLDADDEWKPGYLATQVQLVEKYPYCDVFATNYVFCDGRGNVSKPIIRRLPFKDEDGEMTNYFEVASHSHPPLWTSAIMVRKSAITEIGGFPVGIRSGEDLITWARLAVKHRIAYKTQPFALYNIKDYSNREIQRIPDKSDIVGKELQQLFNKHHISALRKYLSHWQKMRSSVFLRCNKRKSCIKEAFKGLYYNIFNFKLYGYIILALLPFNPYSSYNKLYSLYHN